MGSHGHHPSSSLMVNLAPLKSEGISSLPDISKGIGIGRSPRAAASPRLHLRRRDSPRRIQSLPSRDMEVSEKVPSLDQLETEQKDTGLELLVTELQRENQELRLQQQAFVRGNHKFMGGGQFRSPKKCEECAELKRALRELEKMLRNPAQWEEKQALWNHERGQLLERLKVANDELQHVQREQQSLQQDLQKSTKEINELKAALKHDAARHVEALEMQLKQAKKEWDKNEKAWKCRQAEWEKSAACVDADDGEAARSAKELQNLQSQLESLQAELQKAEQAEAKAKAVQLEAEQSARDCAEKLVGIEQHAAELTTQLSAAQVDAQ